YRIYPVGQQEASLFMTSDGAFHAPYRTTKLRKAEKLYCHPERSEGSMFYRLAQINGALYTPYKRDSSLRSE
ncbi:MAG: hypothetical protein QMD05_07450, partial [Candidatus Brocadiaceae bacterium]|nr:hypothetical protein [Candidatus Brocadiaceae bacterium]